MFVFQRKLVVNRLLMAWVVAGVAFSGISAQAQERLVAMGQGITISVAMPDFAAQGVPEVSRQSGIAPAGQHIVINELIPHGESFENWSSLYAIKLEERVALSFGEYVSQLFSIYLKACDLTTDMIGVKDLGGNHIQLLIPCQSYTDNPAVGEVAAFDIRQQDDDFINIYQHWRGAAFRADNPASWPDAAKSGVAGLMRRADTAQITQN